MTAMSSDGLVSESEDAQLEEVAVNGMKSDSDNESGSKGPSLTPSKVDSSKTDTTTYTVAGKVRKSSMERLLEEKLNTSENDDEDADVFIERHVSSPSSEGASISSSSPVDKPVIDITEGAGVNDEQADADKQSSESEDAQLEEVAVNGMKSDSDNESGSKGPSLTPLKVDSSKTDITTYTVAGKVRKSSMERLLEEKLDTSGNYDEDADVFTERHVSIASSGGASISSSTSVDDDGVRKRRTSVYEQKQIEAPSAVKGNRIAARTEHLLKQYEKDLAAPVDKPVIDITEGAGANDDQTDADSSAERKIENIKIQYQQRLIEDEKERYTERPRIVSNSEGKRKPLATHMNRYIARTEGKSVEHSSDEDDQLDNNALYDEHGKQIERSGGKIEIVKSSDSISSIRNKFGGSTKWKKTENETPNEVDHTKVKSALNVFKEKELKIQETSSTFNRPKSRKVRDPKELMEIRKKATYGNAEELPEDGVVKKTVVIEKEELDTTIKHHALNVYKNLEKKEGNHLPLHKPKTKLISDVEAQATMEVIRTISSSASEESNVDDTTNDLTGDAVSGYSSAAPCSPSSTLSEDYLSDHKEEFLVVKN